MQQWGWVMDSLPWYGQEFDETRALMGENFYAYGLKACESSYELALRYVFEQGLTKPIVAITPKRLEQYRRTPTLNETGMSFHYYMQRSVVGAPGMSAGARRFYESHGFQIAGRGFEEFWLLRDIKYRWTAHPST